MKHTRSIAMTGLLIGLSVVLTRFASFRLAIGNIEGIRVGFGGLPTIMAGILLGPGYGFIAGAFSDIIGFALSPMGAYMPHFTLTAALTGAIPGLVFGLLTRNKESDQVSIVHFGVSVLCAIVLISWGLTPYFLHTLFGLDYRMIMPVRIVGGIITLAVYPVLIRAIYTPVAKIAVRTITYE